MQDFKPEECLRRLARAAEDDLALGALSQEWAHHFVSCKVPPRHIDEHLQSINDIRPNQSPDSENHSPPDIAEITVVSRQKYLNAILRQGKNEACVSVTHDWQAAAVCKRGKQGG